jgi:hypothetical protein
MSTIRFHLRGSRALINGSLAVRNDGVARVDGWLAGHVPAAAGVADHVSDNGGDRNRLRTARSAVRRARRRRSDGSRDEGPADSRPPPRPIHAARCVADATPTCPYSLAPHGAVAQITFPCGRRRAPARGAPVAAVPWAGSRDPGRSARCSPTASRRRRSRCHRRGARPGPGRRTVGCRRRRPGSPGSRGEKRAARSPGGCAARPLRSLPAVGPRMRHARFRPRRRSARAFGAARGRSVRRVRQDLRRTRSNFLAATQRARCHVARRGRRCARCGRSRRRATTRCALDPGSRRAPPPHDLATHARVDRGGIATPFPLTMSTRCASRQRRPARSRRARRERRLPGWRVQQSCPRSETATDRRRCARSSPGSGVDDGVT